MVFILQTTSRTQQESNSVYKKRIKRQQMAANKRQKNKIEAEKKKRLRNRHTVQRHRNRMADERTINK